MATASRKRRNGEGTITKYKGDRWRAKLLLADYTTASRVFDRYSDAETWLSEQRKNRDHGVTEWVGRRMPTLYEWLDQWIDAGEGRLKPKTIEGYRGVRKRYIPKRIGLLPLNKVSAVLVEDLYKRMANAPTLRNRKEGSPENATYSAATVHQTHRVLRAAFRAAHKKGVIIDNPMTRVTAPPAPKPRTDALSMDELRLVLEAASEDRLCALWRLSLLNGLRQGESLAICWDDLDLENATVRIARQIRRVGSDWVFASTKAEDVTVLPIDPDTVKALHSRRVAQARERLAAGPDWGDCEYDLVFTTKTGRPIDDKNDRENWKRLLKHAGVRGIRRHDARHTAATLAYQATGDAKHVQVMMRHRDPAFTLRTYVHPGAEDLRQGHDALMHAVAQ